MSIWVIGRRESIQLFQQLPWCRQYKKAKMHPHLVSDILQSSNMQLFLFAILVAAVSAGSLPAYNKEPEITITSQSDVRNLDGSSQWSFAGSDGTTRDEAQAQKQLPGYDKEVTSGNTNQGNTYYTSPEGQKITLSWVADENGFQPTGDHLPTPPPIPEEIARVLPTLPKLAESY